MGIIGIDLANTTAFNDYLELKVGILSTRNFMFIDVGVAAFHRYRALEWSIQLTSTLPVGTVSGDVIQIQTSIHIYSAVGRTLTIRHFG